MRISATHDLATSAPPSRYQEKASIIPLDWQPKHTMTIPMGSGSWNEQSPFEQPQQSRKRKRIKFQQYHLPDMSFNYTTPEGSQSDGQPPQTPTPRPLTQLPGLRRYPSVPPQTPALLRTFSSGRSRSSTPGSAFAQKRNFSGPPAHLQQEELPLVPDAISKKTGARCIIRSYRNCVAFDASYEALNWKKNGEKRFLINWDQEKSSRSWETFGQGMEMLTGEPHVICILCMSPQLHPVVWGTSALSKHIKSNGHLGKVKDVVAQARRQDAETSRGALEIEMDEESHHIGNFLKNHKHKATNVSHRDRR